MAAPAPSPSSSSCSSLSSNTSRGRQPRCAVCGDAAPTLRFGVRACRACAAFFRRCVVAEQAISACRQSDAKCLASSDTRKGCQACRYRRCLVTGMQIQGKDSNSDSLRPQPALYTTLQQQLYLQRLELAFKKFQERQHEMLLQQPASSSLVNYERALSTDIAQVSLFIDEGFQESRDLPSDQLTLLKRNFFLHFIILEAATNVRECDVETSKQFYFLNPPCNSPTTSEVVQKEGMLANYQRHIRLFYVLVNEPLRKLNIDRRETLAMSALLFWIKELDCLTQRTIDIAKQVQNRVLAELLEHQRSKGVSVPALRIANITLVVGNIQRLVQELEEVFEVFRKLQLFLADKNLEKRSNSVP